MGGDSSATYTCTYIFTVICTYCIYVYIRMRSVLSCNCAHRALLVRRGARRIDISNETARSTAASRYRASLNVANRCVLSALYRDLLAVVPVSFRNVRCGLDNARFQTQLSLTRVPFSFFQVVIQFPYPLKNRVATRRCFGDSKAVRCGFDYGTSSFKKRKHKMEIKVEYTIL